MRRGLFAALALVCLAATAAPAHSSAHVVVYNNYFAPVSAQIEPGHEVTWTWSCDGYGGGCAGTHNVTAYEGAAFASGDLAGPGSYTATVPAGVDAVRYRCTLHSSLSASNCNGMCGILGTDGRAPMATLSSPTENEAVVAPTVPVPVRFSGAATDDVGVVSVTVRVFDLIGRETDVPGTCEGGCGGTAVAWTADGTLQPGTYLAEVAASDAIGNTYRSPRTRFFVL